MKATKTKTQSARFKIFHELMAVKVRHILLLSTSYEAWIMEEDCRLSEQIINEYRGLNLSHPPHLTWVSSVEEALEQIETRHFDLVITISRTIDSDASRAGDDIKEKRPDMPVILCSGFSAKIENKTAEDIGIRKYIEKPVNLEKLSRIIREVMDE